MASHVLQALLTALWHAHLFIVPASGEDDMLRAMLGANNTELDPAGESGALHRVPVSRAPAPKIRMSVVSGSESASPAKPKVLIKVAENPDATAQSEESNEKKSKYFYENGILLCCSPYILSNVYKFLNCCLTLYREENANGTASANRWSDWETDNCKHQRRGSD